MSRSVSKSAPAYYLSAFVRIVFILVFAFSPLLQSIPVVQAAPLAQESDPALPAAPQGMTAAALEGAVQLTWQPNSEADLAGYNLYRGLSSGVYDLTALNGDTLITGPSYLDQNLEDGSIYFYVVKAVNAAGESAASEEASTAPLAAPLKETGRQPADEEIDLYADDPITPQAVAAWTAYNDCQNVTTSPADLTTKITTVRCHQASTGNTLRKYADNSTVSGITFNVAINSTITQQVDSTTWGAVPTAGDALTVFNPYVTMRGGERLGSTSATVTLTFSGLSPTKTYTFATSANRAGGSTYSDRLTTFTIGDYTSASNTSSTGTTTTATTTTFSTGENTTNGYIARWENINPGTDGDFTIVSSNPNSGTSYPSGPAVFLLSEEVSGPTITTTGTLSAFSAAPGMPSTAQTYTVAGTNLTEPITITPPAGFEISLTSGSDFVANPSTLSLPATSGTVATTTIYARMNVSTAGSYSDNIAHTSTGATTVNVAASGATAHTLSVTAANGSVALSPTGGTYAYNASVQLTATANSGYMFTGWSGDLTGNTNPTTITMDGNKAVTANFVPGTCATVDLTASLDNYMSAADVTYNNGGNTEIHVDNTTGTSRRGALLQWDLSSIPSNAVVSAASLKVYVTDASPLVFNLYAMRRAWVEGTSTQAASSTSSNWNTYDGSHVWGAEGAASTSVDRYDTNLWGAGTTSFSSTGSKTVAFNSDGINVVQNWIDGDLANYGLAMQNYSGSTSNAVFFSSSEATTAANRPILNVTYCAVSGPTITTSGTLSAFAAALGTPSTAQTYTVSGSLLTADIAIAAPTGFELSTDGSSYNPSLTLTQSGGSVASTTIYVRLTGVSTGTFSGDIVHTSAGATTKNVAASGTTAIYYALTTHATNGSIALSPTGGSYANGTVVTLTATANSGYIFTGWSGNLTGSANPATLTMDGAKDVTANFVAGTCATAALTATEDTYLSANDVTFNNGGTTDLHVDANNGSTTTARRTALLKWNVSSIPSDAVISSANLQLNVSDASSIQIYLYNLRRAWVEGSSNRAVSSTSANWNTYDGSNGWGTVGAYNTTSDRYDTNLWGADTSTFSSTGSKNVSLNSDGLAVVQGWVSGSLSNYGLTMQNMSGTTSNALYVYSSEYTTAASRPILNVTYCQTTGPKITVTGTLAAFQTAPGVSSAAQTYTVSGANLTNDITITAPASFEVSSDGATFFSSLTLHPTSGTVSATTISVRLYSGTQGSYGGNITHISSGAGEVDLPITGSVQPQYSLTATSGGNGSVTLSPTGGSYYEGTVVTLTPVASSGYAFGSWTGANNADIIQNNGVYTIVMNGNKSVTANFVVATCSTVNLVASEDTYMSGYNTDYNYGGVDLFKVTNNSSGTSRGALIRWDLSSIPSNASISSATVSLYVRTASTQTYNLYAMRRAWVEGTLTTGASSITSANWETYDGVNPWGTNGAANTTADRYDTNLWGAGTSSFTPSGSKTVSLNASGVAVLQGWVSGSLPNNGLTMQNYSSTSGSDDLQISSSENTTTANRPTLNVTYCVAPTTDPTITITSSLTEFSGYVNVYSAEQSYNVGGVNLTAPILITAPANFEVSTTSGNGFGSTVSLTPSSGTVASTTIYARFRRASTGTSTGNITHTSTGATQVNISVSGSATNSAPALSLVQPADNATGVSTPPALSVAVTDANGDASDVSFYGRQTSTGGPAEDFMFVIFPDIQNESQYNTAMLTSQANWVVNNKTANNIVFATTVGDTVNTSSDTTQYQNADAAFDILDAGGVAYTVAPGNHDSAYGTSYYANYFGVSRYASHLYSNGGWFGGSYNDLNTYSLFSAGGMDFILINLQYSPATEVINWADTLLTTYSDRRAIVEQHDLLNVNNSWNNQTSYNALRDHDNLFLMLCGHMHSASDGAAYLAGSGTGGAGQTIHIVQADYQDFTNGNGYLRLLRFSPADDTIYMTTYSPYTSGSITTSPDQMDLAYAMSGGSGTAAVSYSLIGTASDVPSGSNASVSWTGLSENTEYEWYAVANDGTVDTTSSTWSFTTGTASANQAPVITEGSSTGVTMSEDGQPTAFSLTLNATDANAGDTLTWSISTAASNGSASASGTGTSKAISYAPTANYSGADSFVVQVSDGNGGTDTITVNVTISAVNDPPVANAQAVTVTEDTPQPVTLTGSDQEGSNLTFTIVANPTNGTLTGTAPDVTYSPASNFNGADSFTFRVHDGTVNSATATVSITVSPVNDAPVANAQAVTVTEDTPQPVTLTGSDVENSTLTFSIVTNPANGALTGTIPNLTYTPGSNYSGSDSFTFRVNDGGLNSATATVSITVNAVNDAPVANAQTASTTANHAVAITLTGSDVEGSSLTYSIVANPTHGALTGTIPNLTYTPGSNYTGSDSFTFRVYDGDLYSPAATVSITVNAEANVAPVITESDPQAVSIPEDSNSTAFNLTLHATDANAGDTLTWSVSTAAGHGTAAASGTGASIAVGYTPAANYSGADSFVVQVADGHDGTDTITVNVTINAVNDAPEITGQSLLSTNEDTALTLALANLTVTDVDNTYPTGFSLSVGTGSNYTVSGVIITPVLNFNGVLTVPVTVTDGGGAISNSYNLSVTVNPVNDAPSAVDDIYAVNQGGTLTVNAAAGVLANDTDVEGVALSAVQVSGPAHGTLTLNANGSFEYAPVSTYTGTDTFTYRASDGVVSSTVTTVTITVSGEVPPLPSSFWGEIHIYDNPPVAGNLVQAYKPGDVGAVANAVIQVSGSTLRYTIEVPGGSKGSASQGDTITFQINGRVVGTATWRTGTNVELNFHPPQAVPGGPYTGNNGAAISFSATANDWGGDVTSYQWDWENDGTFDDTGASQTHTWPATGSYTGALRVTDARGGVGTATFGVTVTNAAPVLNPIGNKTVNELSLLTFTATATDTDTLTYSLVDAPTGAAINPSTGDFTWTPTEAQGPSSNTFTVRVCDAGQCASETITVTVNEVNQAPVLGAIGNRTINELTLLSFTASASDADLPATTFTYSLISAPTGAAINPSTGAFTWTPTEAQGPSSNTFTVQVCDANTVPLCASETITVTVNEVNQAPVLGAIGNKTVVEMTPLAFTASATDSDLPVTTFTYSLIGAPTGAAINPSTGAFTWTPTDDQGPADYTFSVQVCDANTVPLCASETITVHVTAASQTHSIALIAGWNLVSFNVHPDNTAIAAVLSSINGNYDLVYAWDASGGHSGSGNWMKYDPTGQDWQNSLSALTEQMGFWVHMTTADTLEVTGALPQTSSISLTTTAGGWNLVGYPSQVDGALPEIMLNHGATDFSIVYAYHAAETANPWKLYDRTGTVYSNDLHEMAPGWGYWIYMTAGNIWSVNFTQP